MRVIVATPLGNGGNGGIDRLMDFLRDEIVRAPAEGVDVAFWATRGQGTIISSVLVFAWFLVRLILAKIGGRVHLLHVNLAGYGSTHRKLIICRLSRVLDIPYVLHLHGGDYDVFWRRDASAGLRRRMQRMFGKASRVIVLGRIWRGLALEINPAAKTRILMNATPPFKRERRTPEKKVLLLFLGQLGERKGVPELISAAHRLACVPGWHMIMAGDGEVNEARAAIADKQLSDRVFVQGWVGPSEVASLLARADVLVLPSHRENLPMSVIEGMAAGLAVVTTPVGAIPELIRDEENGLLVPAGDVGALAAALERTIRNPELRAQLGVAGAAFHAEELAIAQYWQRLTSIWKEASADRML